MKFIAETFWSKKQKKYETSFVLSEIAVSLAFYTFVSKITFPLSIEYGSTNRLHKSVPII